MFLIKESLNIEPRYIQIQGWLKKKNPRYAILEKILGQEPSLFGAGSVEVIADHLFLMIFANTAMLGMLPFRLTKDLNGEMWSTHSFPL